jgi:leucyl aminopeptidase
MVTSKQRAAGLPTVSSGTKPGSYGGTNYNHLMPTTVPASSVALASGKLSDIKTDLLVVPMFEGENGATAVAGLDEAAGGALGRATDSGEFRGRMCDLFLTPLTGWGASRVALIGAGKPADFDTERLRKAAAAAGLAARQRRVKRIAVLSRSITEQALAAQAIAEGLVLANFSGDVYKSGERSGPPLEQALVAAGQGQDAALQAAVERGRVLGESCNLARELCNEPANVLTPSVFAERGAEIGRIAGLHVEVLDEEEIARLRMGLLLGVARGSAEPPRMLVLRYTAPHAPASPILGLVGKGITFDTGGISIKPAEGMDRMKDDMAGGAAVIGAMRAIAVLKAPIDVVGVVPMTENMPGGRALKPGDIITGASGKSVEVLNTDAEGRLILGDALWYAQKLGATHLVDVATLTGACVVALGRAASGLFAQPQRFAEVVRRTSDRAGDRCWPMPLFDEYREQLKSEIADMVNVGGRPAGVCTAAMFIREFVGDMPWAHLDIAGTAWADDAKPWMPKGATGVAVRTLAELPFTSGEW